MYTVKIIEDNKGHLVLPLSDEVLQYLKLDIGDTIVWTDNQDGTFNLTKKEEDVTNSRKTKQKKSNT